MANMSLATIEVLEPSRQFIVSIDMANQNKDDSNNIQIEWVEWMNWKDMRRIWRPIIIRLKQAIQYLFKPQIKAETQPPAEHNRND